MSDYNGWTNWETWNLNLHLDDGETLEMLVEQAGSVADGADAIQEWVETWCDELVEHTPLAGTIFHDFINASLHDVDWRELAKNHKPESWGDSDDAPEDDDDDDDDDETEASDNE